MTLLVAVTGMIDHLGRLWSYLCPTWSGSAVQSLVDIVCFEIRKPCQLAVYSVSCCVVSSAHCPTKASEEVLPDLHGNARLPRQMLEISHLNGTLAIAIPADCF